MRIKAVMSLGNFSVLNMLQPTVTATTTTTAPNSDPDEIVGADGGGYNEDGSGSSVWIDSVVGRKSGATTPLLDVAFVVIPSERRVANGRQCSRDVADGGYKDTSEARGRGVRRGRRGLEARAKVKIDKLEAIVSLPFIENLVQHVLTGPLASHVLLGQEKSEGLNNPECRGHVETPLSLTAQPPTPTGHLVVENPHSSLVAAGHDDHGKSWAARGYPGSGEVRVEGRRASPSSPKYAIVGDHSRNLSGEVPPQTNPDPTGYGMKPVVLLKVCIGRGYGGGEVFCFASQWWYGFRPGCCSLGWVVSIILLGAHCKELTFSPSFPAPAFDHRKRSLPCVFPGQLGLELCESTVELPFSQAVDSDDGGCLAVTLGHVIAAAKCVSSTSGDSVADDPEGGGGSNSGRETRPTTVGFEVLTSSVGIRVNPESFDLLEDVHARVTGVLPLELLLGQQAGLDKVGSGQSRVPHVVRGDATMSYGRNDNRDELLDKLRERSTRNNVELTSLLPARPVLALDAVVGDSTTGIGAPCTQLAVAVSPVRFNLAESHILSLTCATLDIATRMANVAALLTSPASLPRTNSDSAALESPVTSDSGEREHQQLLRSGETAVEGLGNPVAVESSPTATVTPADTEERGFASAGVSPPTSRNVDQDPEQKQCGREGLDVDVPVQSVRKILSRSAGQKSDGQLSGDLDAVALLPSREEIEVDTDGTNTKAPVPPLILGTLIVQAVTVMILTDEPGLGHRQTLKSRASASTIAAAHTHNPLLCLDIEGLGVGVDLAPQLPVSSRDDRVGRNINAVDSRKRRVEMAVKRISLTDVSQARGKDSLVQLVGEGVRVSKHKSNVDTVNSSADCAGHHDDSIGRVLPVNWWRFGADGEIDRSAADVAGYGYDEQLLLRFALCPESNEVRVMASIASGHFMLLPAPILDMFRLASDLERNVARHCRSARSREERLAPLPVVTSSSTNTSRERGRTASDQQYTTPNLRRGDGDHGNEHISQESWRQLVRDLGGSAVSDTYPWLQLVQLEISANSLQLWLPDVTSHSAMAATRDSEAIVACCSCQLSLSLLTSVLVNGRSGGGYSLESAVAAEEDGAEGMQDSQAREENSRRGEDRVPIPNPHVTDDEPQAAAETSPALSTDRCEDICIVKLCLHDIEVFVARPPMADFGPRILVVPDVQDLSSGMPITDHRSRVGVADDDRKDSAEDEVHGRESVPNGVYGDGVSRDRPLKKCLCVVLPFNVELNHVLSVGVWPASWSPPLSSLLSAAQPSSTRLLLSASLLSDMSVNVTEIHARYFTNFPLAARVLAHTIMPLVEVQEKTRPTAGTVTENDISERVIKVDENDGSMAGGVTTGAEGASGTSDALWSKLAAMWAGRVRLEAEGFRMTVVNNLYRRQHVPALNFIVSCCQPRV